MPFNLALSGLNAATTDLTVTANNIANVSTNGFKGSRAEFAEMFAVSPQGVASTATGNGVRVAAVAQQFTQGNIDNTGNSLDLAISGQGFFTLSDNGALLYTRAGSFQTDSDGYVVTSQNQRLQVYPPAASGGFNTGTLTDLRIATGESAPKATTAVQMLLNLPSDAALPANPTFDPTDTDSYNRATSLTVYDSLGAAHTGTVYFKKTAPGTWDTYLYVDGAPVGTLPATPATPGTGSSSIALTPLSYPPASGSIVVNGNPVDMTVPAAVTDAATLAAAIQAAAPAGTTVTYNAGTDHFDITNTGSAALSFTGVSAATYLGTVASTGVSAQAPAQPAGAAAPQTLAFNALGELITPANGMMSYPTYTPATGAATMNLSLDFGGATQYGSNFGVTSLTQDGYTTGQLIGINIDKSGAVEARFTNGQSLELGQVALANFTNQNGLQQLSDTNWAQTFGSGEPMYGQAGGTGFGLVQSGALEASNVDITAQLVNMITAQRNFQANAQMIQTADTITQTIINIR